MVNCAVMGCSSNNNKRSKNFSDCRRFFRFPRDKQVCEQWILKCYQKCKFSVKSSRVCSKHFLESDYCLKEKLLNLPQTKWKLKSDAVPSLHLLKLPSVPTLLQQRRIIIRTRRPNREPIKDLKKKKQEKANTKTETPELPLTTDDQNTILNEEAELDSGNTKQELPESYVTTDDEEAINESLTIKSEPDEIEIEEHKIEGEVTTKSEIGDHEMDVEETNPFELDTYNDASTSGNNSTYTVNSSPALVKQTIQNNWKNIVKKTFKPTVAKELAPTSPEPIEKETRKRKKTENTNTIELCVLCGKDLSRHRQKNSVAMFFDLIFLVTDVNVTQYSISPIACGVCYKFLFAIQRFQDQVREAKVLILKKLANAIENVPLQQIEFLDTNNYDIHSFSELSAQADIRNQFRTRPNHPKDTSELPSLCNTENSIESLISQAENLENVFSTGSIKSPSRLDITEGNNKYYRNNKDSYNLKNEIVYISEVNHPDNIKIELTQEIEDIEIQNDVELPNFPQSTSELSSLCNTEMNEIETENSNINNVTFDSSSCLNIAPGDNPEIYLPISEENDQSRIKIILSQEELNKSENDNAALLNLPQCTSELNENNIDSVINKVKPIETNSDTAVSTSQAALNTRPGNQRYYKKYKVLNKPIRKVPTTAWLERAGYVRGKLYAYVCKKQVKKTRKFPLVTCKQCNKVLQSTSMPKHMQMHKREEEPTQSDKCVCSECGKIYNQPSGLQRHQITHGEKKHICRICKQSFHFLSYLTRHMRSHSGEKPFACTDCGKTFSILWNFHQHRRLHTNSKPYKCQLCSAAFRHNVTLKGHIVKTHAANAIMSVTANDVPSTSRSTE